MVIFCDALLFGCVRRMHLVRSTAEPRGRSLSSTHSSSWGFSKVNSLLNRGQSLQGSSEKMWRLKLIPHIALRIYKLAVSWQICDVQVLTFPWAGKQILGNRVATSGKLHMREQYSPSCLLLMSCIVVQLTEPFKAKVSCCAAGFVGLRLKSRAAELCPGAKMHYAG